MKPITYPMWFSLPCFLNEAIMSVSFEVFLLNSYKVWFITTHTCWLFFTLKELFSSSSLFLLLLFYLLNFVPFLLWFSFSYIQLHKTHSLVNVFHRTRTHISLSAIHLASYRPTDFRGPTDRPGWGPIPRPCRSYTLIQITPANPLINPLFVLDIISILIGTKRSRY